MTREYLLVEELASEVGKRLAGGDAPLRAFWVQVLGDRSAYAAALRQALRQVPATVVVVRQAGFDDPNSVLFELVRLLEANRTGCEADLASFKAGPVAVVLLARSGLNLAQASSPIELPGWFPGGGRQVDAVIEDLTWEADAPLNSAALRVPDIAEAVFELEGTLLRRLADVNRVDKNASDKFLAAIRHVDEFEVKFDQLLKDFTSGRGATKNPHAYRPSIRSKNSLIARLWILGHQLNPEDRAPSSGLARALQLPDNLEIPRASLLAVTKRPAPQRDEKRNQIFCQQLIATVAAACQLTTAAAHADDYDSYPVTLLIAISFDLRRALADAELVIRSQG